jgi:hypothetical protein
VIAGSRNAFSVPLLIFEALVVSVIAEFAKPVTPLAAGCEQVGTPAELIEAAYLFDPQDPPMIEPPPGPPPEPPL